MSQPLVLAIEPDLRQAAIVKRIVREKALADVVVVDSRDAAIAAIRTNMPDVLLLSQLLSPRDEDELIAHLRTLENAGHLQTHTIPQLASTLDPGEERSSRGLLSAFRRKKEAATVAGCDPDLFADEIRTYLAQADNKKREPQGVPFVPPVSRREPGFSEFASSATEATHHEAEDTAAMESSWASPFEWKPASSSTKKSTRSREDAPAHKSVPVSEPPPPAPVPEPVSAAPVAAEPIVEAPSVIKPVEEPIAAAPVLAEPVAPQPVAEPFAAAPPLVEGAADQRPAVESVLVADAVVIKPPPGSLVSERVGKLVEPPPKKATRPKPVADRPAKLTRSQLQDLIRKQAASDRLDPDGLGPLTRWARSDAPSAAKNAPVTSDDVRSLLSELAVPTAVASVTYPTGVRLRRVRVPLSSDHDAVQASA